MSATPVLDAHRGRLISLFADELARHGPGRVLDVGCGRGTLLGELAERGLAAEGVEAGEASLAAARASGHVVHHGSALALPCGDRSFDTVVIRHVLHHLPEPRTAVAEAWRVARRLVVLSEPHTERSFPTQVAMAELDAFTSELLVRRGEVHGEPLRAGELVALAPEPPTLGVSRSWGALVPAPASEVAALILAAAGDRELGARDAARRAGHLARAERGELSFHGSLAVFLARPES